MRIPARKKITVMMPEDFIEYINAAGRDEAEMLTPAERLLLLGIDPFSFYRKKRKSVNIDEDEYNDDFDDEPGSVDEEPQWDEESEIISYIHDDDEVEEYELSELKDCPFLRAVLQYNNNRRKYYC